MLTGEKILITGPAGRPGLGLARSLDGSGRMATHAHPDHAKAG